MTDDEFDVPHPAPVSPHDRTWRHPAEHSLSERQQHLATTPPLGRRLTALTAAVSVVSSVAVLIVAIPRGISTTAEATEEAPATSVPLVKGTARAFATVVDASDRATPAIPLGNGCWLVSTADLDEQSPKWITTSDGQRIKVDTVGEVDDSDLVVVKSSTAQDINTQVAFSELNSDTLIDNYKNYRVMDTTTNALFALAPSLSMTTATPDIPIMTPAPIRNLAVVVDDVERIVGVVVRRGYSTWMLGKETLASIMDMTTGK
ncbi:MAG: hypothetical protein F2545_05370 [Actinobacteria bacterium]|uniref:Unannotated protein n=1 Tax=freshwater metagenome TaxID=449393 RepID=A0A6J6DNA0_9ZZZZ|nr:hypothetical protein [Actinomycetota bacterium]